MRYVLYFLFWVVITSNYDFMYRWKSISFNKTMSVVLCCFLTMERKPFYWKIWISAFTLKLQAEAHPKSKDAIRYHTLWLKLKFFPVPVGISKVITTFPQFQRTPHQTQTNARSNPTKLYAVYYFPTGTSERWIPKLALLEINSVLDNTTHIWSHLQY